MNSGSDTDHDRLVRMETQLADIRKALLGNGQPGMVRDVAVLKQELEDLKKTVPSKMERYGALGTVVTVVVSILAKLFGLPVPV